MRHLRRSPLQRFILSLPYPSPKISLPLKFSLLCLLITVICLVTIVSFMTVAYWALMH